MELYRETWGQVMLSPAADERIRRALLAGSSPAPVHRSRRSVKTALAVLAAVCMLTAAALAASGLSFGEMGESLRQLMGLETTGAIPEPVVYETVKESSLARQADPTERGVGELYVTEADSIYGENLLVMEMSVRTVTPEQRETLVWRVKMPEGDVYIPAEMVDYRSYFTGNVLILRAAIPLEYLTEGDCALTVTAGRETEGGYFIERLGTVTARRPEEYTAKIAVLPEGIPFPNETTGETGYITTVELYPERLVLRCEAAGIHDAEQAAREMAIWDPERVIWHAWTDGLNSVLYDSTLVLADGETVHFMPSVGMTLPDDTWLVPVDIGELDEAAVTGISIGGSMYELEKSD